MAPKGFGGQHWSSVRHVNDLSDHCLSLIFGYLPVKQLFSLPLVCTKWNRACAVHCASLNTLLLSTHISAEQLRTRCFPDVELCDFFEVSHFKQAFTLMEDKPIEKDSSEPVKFFQVVNLVRKFPKVTRLTLFRCNLFAEHVAQLLCGWPRLVELKLVKIDVITNPYEWHLIFAEITKQSDLRCLSLYLERYPFPTIVPTMKRLHEFHLGVYDFPHYHNQLYLFHIWTQLSTTTLQHTSIGFFVDDIDLTILDRSLEQLALVRPQTLTALTRVKLPEDAYEILPLLHHRNFPSIRYLDTVYKQSVFSLQHLTALAHVTELTLRRSAYEKDHECGYHFLDGFELEPNDCDQMRLLPRMASVVRLQLVHLHIDPRLCSIIFPNATVERIDVDGGGGLSIAK